MKVWLLSFMMLIAYKAYSQDTIPVTISQAKQAIRNAQKVEVLSLQCNVQTVLIENQDVVIDSLEERLRLEELRFQILESNIEYLSVGLETKSEVDKKNKWIHKALIFIGAFSTGYVIGSL